MRQCTQGSERLKAYVDRQLPPLFLALTRRHVERCARCRNEVSAMEQISRRLRTAAVVDLQPDLRSRILDALPDGPPPAASRRERTARERNRLVLWAGGAVAVVAWFVLYPVVARERAPGDLPPSRVARSEIRPAAAGSGAVAGVPASGLVARARTLGMVPRELTMSKPGLPGASSVPADENVPPEDDALLPAERQVHREADISLTVDNVEAKSERVQNIATEAGGYVAENDLSTGDGDIRAATLAVKAPVARFNSVLNQIARLGVLTGKHVSAEDVTEELSDRQQVENVLHTDVAAAQAQLNRYMSRPAKAQAAEALRQLRIRLAQAEARVRLLSRFAAVGTIRVTMQEKQPAAPMHHTGFLDDMSDTAHMALHSFIEAAKVPVLLLIWLIAYAPIWIVLAMAYRYAFRTA